MIKCRVIFFTLTWFDEITENPYLTQLPTTAVTRHILPSNTDNGVTERTYNVIDLEDGAHGL